MARDHRAGSTFLQRLLDGPVGEALMERVADAVLTWGKTPPAERPKKIVIDADFEDLPAKPDSKRNKPRLPPELPG